ncbi:MAG: tetratricopeptide repeat protein [Gemmatimonadota bacterium]|nr:tetratricopeptide repeat protein [Gemmatimonadota bacterium]
MGVIYAVLSRFEEAEAHLRRAIALDPQEKSAYLNLGVILEELGRYEEALDVTRAAIEQAPDLFEVHFNLGAILEELGRYEEAIGALAQAAALAPTSSQAAELHFLMGETAQDNEQPEAATQYYMRAFEIDPHHVKALDGIAPHCVEAFHKLASLRTNQQRYEEALELFQCLLDIDPSDAVAHGNMGIVLFYLGRSNEALQGFDRALFLNPNLETARANREALLEAIEGNRQ